MAPGVREGAPLRPDMCVQWWAVPLAGDGVALLADVTAECVATDWLAVPVEALAMVRPQAIVAPSAAAATAVPMSGRLIRTCYSLVIDWPGQPCPGHGPGWPITVQEATGNCVIHPARLSARAEQRGPGAHPGGGVPSQMARTAPMVSASAAGLSGRCRRTRANRSATPPG